MSYAAVLFFAGNMSLRMPDNVFVSRVTKWVISGPQPAAAVSRVTKWVIVTGV